MKKKWGKPFLRVIIRNKPEETVLTACKALNIAGPSVAADKNCMNMGFPCNEPGVTS